MASTDRDQTRRHQFPSFFTASHKVHINAFEAIFIIKVWTRSQPLKNLKSDPKSRPVQRPLQPRLKHSIKSFSKPCLYLLIKIDTSVPIKRRDGADKPLPQDDLFTYYLARWSWSFLVSSATLDPDRRQNRAQLSYLRVSIHLVFTISYLCSLFRTKRFHSSNVNFNRNKLWGFNAWVKTRMRLVSSSYYMISKIHSLCFQPKILLSTSQSSPVNSILTNMIP